MERRHLFEREMQRKALEEFDDLARMNGLVDWDSFVPALTEIFGACGSGTGSAVLGCAGDVPVDPAGCDAFAERPQASVHAAGPTHVQAVRWTSEQRSGAG